MAGGRKEDKRMNKVVLMGRLTRDPDIRYTQGESSMAVAHYTLAVSRRFKRQDEEQQADFIRCVTFGKNAEFAEKYLHQGTKICVSGRIQTGSYTNKDGQRVYTTDVVVEEHDFAESRATQSAESGKPQEPPSGSADEDGFMVIPDDMGELPFV